MAQGIGSQKLEEFTGSDTEILATKHCNQLVRIIEEKPIIHACTNNIRQEGLWDTGSMVNTVNKNWLKNNFPEAEILLVEQFMENFPLNLKTANNTNLNVEGAAIINFSLKYGTEMRKVPLIVTNEFLKNRIFGYNLIEDLFVSKKNHKIFETLKSFFPHVQLERPETVSAIMQKVKDSLDELGEIKAAKKIIISSNSECRKSEMSRQHQIRFEN